MNWRGGAPPNARPRITKSCPTPSEPRVRRGIKEEDGARRGWRERERGWGGMRPRKTQPSYFIYRLVSSQPGYAWQESLATISRPRLAAEGKRGEESRPRPDKTRGGLRVLRFSCRRMVRGTAEECIHRLHRCNSNNGRAARFLRGPVFSWAPPPPPPPLLAIAASPRGGFCLFLFLSSVARASGPISSWTSHHSITLLNACATVSSSASVCTVRRVSSCR